jgi:hypothetical protein
MANHVARASLLFLIAAGATTAGPDTVYKSIDAQGNVTYSSTPPETPGKVEQVEEIPLPPGPTEQERRAAEQRARQIEAASARLAAERQQQEGAGAQSVEAASRQLDQARATLEQTKTKKPEDWQYLASGGRVLKQSYLDRVAKAEQRVREAEQALQEARSAQH